MTGTVEGRDKPLDRKVHPLSLAIWFVAVQQTSHAATWGRWNHMVQKCHLSKVHGTCDIHLSKVPLLRLEHQGTMHGYGDPGPDHHVMSHGPPHPLPPYLTDDHSLHQPPSNLSSHIPGTPSELSSPTSE
ncbi:insulin gene enhancer protein ISL-1 [Caerostris extrusa]|uniref:Insulin gene enhancer protein ISL-1 n=1 Tax=Caerostris extrusa TaxID=172846 RepID=A0AAV4YCC7_CAEEX|nr:insulin gene enhancer protein ISL-1 [Caerostris extrusa]